MLKKLKAVYAMFTLSLQELQLRYITARQVLVWTVLVYSRRVENPPNNSS